MVRRCSDKMAKLLMVVFNGLFLVCGIALLVVGLLDIKRVSNVQQILSSLSGLNIAVIVVGAIVCIISLLGLCGALRENSCMLSAFLGLLVIILISELVLGYVAFDQRETLKEKIKDEAFKSLNATTELVEAAWKDVQTSFLCCGANDYTDYEKLHKEIPVYCCKNVNIHKCSPEEKSFHGKGCLPKLEEFMKGHFMSVGVAAIVIAFVEVIGIIFACCLRSAINERYETV